MAKLVKGPPSVDNKGKKNYLVIVTREVLQEMRIGIAATTEKDAREITGKMPRVIGKNGWHTIKTEHPKVASVTDKGEYVGRTGRPAVSDA